MNPRGTTAVPVRSRARAEPIKSANAGKLHGSRIAGNVLNMAIEPAWATRFYGMTVSKEVAAAANDHLTDSSITDLVDAHLGINEAYFGGIDKTLSGFV